MEPVWRNPLHRSHRIIFQGRRLRWAASSGDDIRCVAEGFVASGAVVPARWSPFPGSGPAVQHHRPRVARGRRNEKHFIPWHLEAGVSPRLAHLLFARDTYLSMAQRFDAARGELIGDAFRVADDVIGGFTGRAPFSASENGTLVYWTGGLSGLVAQPRWFDRSGKPAGIVRGRNAATTASHCRLTDEKSRSETFGGAGARRVACWISARGISTRFTFEGADISRLVARQPSIGVQEPFWTAPETGGR